MARFKRMNLKGKEREKVEIQNKNHFKPRKTRKRERQSLLNGAKRWGGKKRIGQN